MPYDGTPGALFKDSLEEIYAEVVFVMMFEM